MSVIRTIIRQSKLFGNTHSVYVDCYCQLPTIGTVYVRWVTGVSDNWLWMSLCSPREPRAMAWGPSSSHTKIFRVERARLKTGDKLPIPCKFCTYRFLRYSSTCYSKIRIDPLMANIRNPDFLPLRWWMRPGLLWFSHVIWKGIC